MWSIILYSDKRRKKYSPGFDSNFCLKQYTVHEYHIPLIEQRKQRKVNIGYLNSKITCNFYFPLWHLIFSKTSRINTHHICNQGHGYWHFEAIQKTVWKPYNISVRINQAPPWGLDAVYVLCQIPDVGLWNLGCIVDQSILVMLMRWLRASPSLASGWRLATSWANRMIRGLGLAAVWP